MNILVCKVASFLIYEQYLNYLSVAFCPKTELFVTVDRGVTDAVFTRDTFTVKYLPQ